MEPEWRRLDQLTRSRPFQSFGWAHAWLTTLGSGCKLRIAVVQSGEEIKAIWPMVVRRLSGLRMLEWVGSESMDYADAIVDPAVDAQALLPMLWSALKAHGGFDLARFKRVRVDSLVHDFLMHQRASIRTEEHAQGVNIQWPDGDSWLKTRSKHARDKSNQNTRALKKLGFALHVWQPGEDYEPMVRALLRQKRDWLRAVGEESVLATEPGAEFLFALAKQLAADGTLHLSSLRNGDRFAACHFGFAKHGVLYYYMPSYESELHKRSPGKVLLDSLVMLACDLKLRRFDMLTGESGYKRGYDTDTEDVRTLVLPRTLIGRVAQRVYLLQRTVLVKPSAAPAPSND